MPAPNPHCFCQGRNGGMFRDYRGGRGGRMSTCDHAPIRRQTEGER